LGKDKKYHDEKLQEVRNKHDKVQYRKRKQQEEDAVRQLKEFEQSWRAPPD
jgi:hypothetical protein